MYLAYIPVWHSGDAPTPSQFLGTVKTLPRIGGGITFEPVGESVKLYCYDLPLLGNPQACLRTVQFGTVCKLTTLGDGAIVVETTKEQRILLDPIK